MCVSNTWFWREEWIKVTFRMGENEKKIAIVLMTIEDLQFLQTVKAIPEDFKTCICGS